MVGGSQSGADGYQLDVDGGVLFLEVVVFVASTFGCNHVICERVFHCEP